MEKPRYLAVASGNPLLPAPLADFVAIEIAYQGALHRFERDAARAWFYHQPHAATDAQAAQHAADPALAKKIEEALTVFERTRIERHFPLEGRSAEYGVALPQMVVLLYRQGESTPAAQFAIGDPAPDTVSQYLLLVGADTVITLPMYQVDNLRKLVALAVPNAAAR